MTQQKPIKLKAENPQIDFLLKDLYFVRTFNANKQNPYSYAIVEICSKTKVYDVITNEIYYPIKKFSISAFKKYGEKLAYNVMPLTKALSIANVTKADPLLTKEDVISLKNKLGNNLKTHQPGSELGR